MADPGRPSFTSFLKRTKEAFTGNRITFVSSESSQSATTPTGNDGEPSPSTKDKAQARRAQVRKAQKQHRERKANYIRQLELDIVNVRELIASAERDRSALKDENEAIRARLTGAATQGVVSPASLLAAPASEPPSESLFTDIDLDELTVSLEMDDVTGTPVYRLSGSPSGSSSAFLSQYTSPQSQAASSTGLPEMTPQQIHQAINFVLALEHPCWNHFGHDDCAHAEIDDDPDPSAPDCGHTMMASCLALRTAPPEVFSSIEQVAAKISQQEKEMKKDKLAAVAAAAAETPVLAEDVSWQASGITLHSLRELANTLPVPDQELTPVQAWFELADRYPTDVLLRPDVHDGLKEAFVGVIKCQHYGALVERGAFESIVNRVIGPGSTSSYSAFSSPQEAGPSGQTASLGDQMDL